MEIYRHYKAHAHNIESAPLITREIQSLRAAFNENGRRRAMDALSRHKRKAARPISSEKLCQRSCGVAVWPVGIPATSLRSSASSDSTLSPQEYWLVALSNEKLIKFTNKNLF